MADEELEAGSRDEELPEVPDVPQLPETPKLKPNLPRLPQSRETEETKEYRRMGIAYTIPVTLVTPIVLLTLIGWWLDERFHKSPIFVLCGALLGTLVGFINMIRLVNRLND